MKMKVGLALGLALSSHAFASPEIVGSADARKEISAIQDSPNFRSNVKVYMILVENLITYATSPALSSAERTERVKVAFADLSSRAHRQLEASAHEVGPMTRALVVNSLSKGESLLDSAAENLTPFTSALKNALLALKKI